MALKIQIRTLSGLSSKYRDSLIKRGTAFKQSTVKLVEKILARVRTEGDEAVRDFTTRYDGVSVQNYRVNASEITSAAVKVPKEVRVALGMAYDNIRNFHSRLLPSAVEYENKGARLGTLLRPYERVGIYVPGGRASYPSSVLMAAIPAKLAGVKRLILCTPPSKNGEIQPEVAYAARLCDVDEIYAVGGAQAIAAMAYGTETIPKVEKIVGPGNLYVSLAKKLVSERGEVGIDFLAGPSEILIIADDSASQSFIAADMLAQAEHDPNAVLVLVSIEGESLIEGVVNELDRQLSEFANERRKVMETVLKNGCALLTAKNVNEAVEFVNEFAPEHLEIVTRQDKLILAKITCTGSVFLGKWSPVALGDYISGTNHILPTMGRARFSSALSPLDFVRILQYQEYTAGSFAKLAEKAAVIAEAEGLSGHAESLRKRLKSRT